MTAGTSRYGDDPEETVAPVRCGKYPADCQDPLCPTHSRPHPGTGALGLESFIWACAVVSQGKTCLDEINKEEDGA